MHPNLLRSPLSLFLVIFLTLYNNVYSGDYLDSRYEMCMSNSSSTCGTSHLKIAYPFWGNGRPEYCGHPNFNLSCDGNTLKINIMSQVYNMIDINYNTSTLRIVHEEFSRSECPGLGELHNTTLDLALFNYTSNVRNVSLYYDCPKLKPLEGAPFTFSCEQRYPNRLSFFVITDRWEHELGKICGMKLYVPVYKDALNDLISHHSSGVGDVLKTGFEVRWVIDQGQCQDCTLSGGACVYNMTLSRSTCFCSSGLYPTVCPQSIDHTPSKGLSLEAKVGIGIGVASGFLLVVITLFVFVRGKQHYHSSSFFTSRKTSQLSIAPDEEQSSYFGAQLFTYNELLQATNNFEPSKELGKGGFGTVYHGVLQNGREVAIKLFYQKQNKHVAQFMNELEILTRLDHKHLVKLYGCTTRRIPELMLVYEYIPNGTVADHLHGQQAKVRSLPWPIRLRIAIETASALVYLHSSDIIHRDVKTKNILLDNNYSVKVVDFGLSRLFPLDASHVSTMPQGSPGYLDPEYQQCYQLTNKSDVYSFGVVLAELISAKPAVDRNRTRQEINLSSLAINKILKHAWIELIDPKLGFKKNSKVTEEVIAVADLIFQCLQATSETRPSMEDVLKCLTRIQDEKSINVSDDLISSVNGSEVCEINKAESTQIDSS
ncbi:LEAF RUST 10 DISEASE-RESISTANCE LOCUS RECEPTOR-LIKE PROTEIN KINASE-like 1.3 [Chenopodium quinoa]|uniref:non-specific serine/threonine protein kinase n=1 Tax=Chenopodium quinoa TaxID=63459 RepID=A0A803MIF6_CHEQI|nr:LEAF RUST 10 DISEASE-RESISTANCE LOCUS RECEPTOR-LIKE PROTEIN KINASE-like 1.3 [Chenopodium quinoa]